MTAAGSVFEQAAAKRLKSILMVLYRCLGVHACLRMLHLTVPQSTLLDWTWYELSSV